MIDVALPRAVKFRDRPRIQADRGLSVACQRSSALLNQNSRHGCPFRPTRPDVARRAARRGRARGRRRRSRRGRDARGVAIGRSARKSGRGVGALRRRRHGTARPGRTPAGGGFDERHQRRVASNALAERAVAMARVAPEDRFAGLADPALLARNFPELDLVDRDTARRSPTWSGRARTDGSRGACGQGRHQIRRQLGVGRHRRHGAGDEPRLFRRLSRDRATASRSRRSPARAPAWRPTTISAPPCMSRDLDAPEQVGRNAGERAVARLNPRKVATKKVPVVFDPLRVGLADRPSCRAPSTAARSRARRASSRTSSAQRLFASGINVIDDPLRPRGLRSRPFDDEGVAGRRMALVEDGVLEDLAARQRDRARARLDQHRPCPARRVVDAVARRRAICISSRALRARTN